MNLLKKKIKKKWIFHSLKKVNKVYLQFIIVGFEEAGLECIGFIASIILNDIKSALEQLGTKEWLKGQLMNNIIITVEDYFREFRETLEPKWMNELV